MRRGASPAIAARTTSGAEIGEVRAVVLADAEAVQADLVGQHRLVDDVAEDLGLRELGEPSGAQRHVAEGVEAE